MEIVGNIFKLVISVIFIIRWVNTTMVFQSRITALKYPEKNILSTYCKGSAEECVCNKCEICLYAKFQQYHDQNIIISHLLAKTQLNLTLIDEFSPSIIKTIGYKFEDDTVIIIEVNKCPLGNETINLDMFFGSFLLSNFFIKCNYCLGYYAEYRLGGLLILNDNFIGKTREIVITITYIEFLHQKLVNKECCNSSLQNDFDKCPVCKYSIILLLEGSIPAPLTFEAMNSFKIQNKLIFRYFLNITDYIQKLSYLKISFVDGINENYLIDTFEPNIVDTLGYSENKYSLTGQYVNVKVNYSYSINSIGYIGRNAYTLPLNNPPTGTTYNLEGIPKCADPTLFYPDCDNFNNDISYCNKNRPCQNNGTCYGTLSAYKCKCRDGFHGKNCEKFHCSKPCVTGKCVNGNLCGSCDPGFGGKGCEEKVCEGYNKCIKGNCSFDKNKERYCECKPNYYGNFCQYRCYLTCVHGECKFTNGLPFCLCNVGWNGVLCDSDSDSVGKSFHSSRTFLILIVIIPIIVIGLIILICFLMTKVIRVNVKKQNDEIHNQILTLRMKTSNTNNVNAKIQNIQPIQKSHESQPNIFEINKNRSLLEKSDNGFYGLNQPVYEDFSFSCVTGEEINSNNFQNKIMNKVLDKNLINSQELNSSANSKIPDQRK